ncbi:hypothetical protein GmHk_14G041838 [Glycine max]|nr:hypothetical protein GmHk_14G041838 [Glycine max]
MVSIRSGLIRDTLFEDSHPHLTTMIDIDTLQQLQNRSTKIDLHKSDKHQPLPKGPRYKRCTPLVTNHTTILEEAFSLEVPIKLPPTKPHKPGLDTTKYCMYHRCIALKDKIKELIQAGYLVYFVKKPDNHQVGARLRGHQEEQQRNHEVDRRRDRQEDRGRQRHQQQQCERQPPQEQEPA